MHPDLLLQSFRYNNGFSMYLCHIAWDITSDTFVIPRIIRKKVAEGLFDWPCLESGLDGVLIDAGKIRIRVTSPIAPSAAKSGILGCALL